MLEKPYQHANELVSFVMLFNINFIVLLLAIVKRSYNHKKVIKLYEYAGKIKCQSFIM